MILTSKKYIVIKKMASKLKIKELSTKFKVSTATICKIKKSRDYTDYRNINRTYARNAIQNRNRKNNWYRPILNFFQI